MLYKEFMRREFRLGIVLCAKRRPATSSICTQCAYVASGICTSCSICVTSRDACPLQLGPESFVFQSVPRKHIGRNTRNYHSVFILYWCVQESALRMFRYRKMERVFGLRRRKSKQNGGNCVMRSCMICTSFG